MLKKFCAFLLAAVLALTFCGCKSSPFNADTLISPPNPTGDFAPIKEALQKSVAGKFKLKFPIGGSYRSAFIFADLEQSGKEDYCVAFYTLSDSEESAIHINLIKHIKDTWVSVSDLFYSAEEIEKVEFADLSKDGFLEILVGYRVYSDVDKKVSVYSISADTMRQRLLEDYSQFIVTDLTVDGKNELFVINRTPSNNSATAALYTLNSGGIKEEALCAIDGNVNSYNLPVLSKLGNDQPAVLVDAYTSKGMITEIIYYKDGRLVAPFFDSKLGMNSVLQRDGNTEITDINNDGRIDVPLLSALTLTANSEGSSYMTTWVNYNGTELYAVAHTVTNSLDNYYIVIPENLAENIGVERLPLEKLRVFYLWDKVQDAPLNELFRIKVEDAASYKSENKDGFFELTRDRVYVYSAKIAEAGTKYNVTEKLLKDSFKLIV